MKREAIAEFGQTCAKDLSQKLIDDILKLSLPMKVTSQLVGTFKTDFRKIRIFYYDANQTFYILTNWIVCGGYETPAQVEAVILKLKAAIKRSDREFTFPTVEDLTNRRTSVKHSPNFPSSKKSWRKEA